MKTRYKFIHFEKLESEDECWICFTNKDRFCLGEIIQYKPWKRLCFFPAPGTVFSQDCLEDIAHFIGQLKQGGTDAPK